MAGNYSYRIESYAYLTNLDHSAAKLNSVLEKYGFKFEWIVLKELETNFSELFGFPSEYKSIGGSIVHINDEPVNISSDFHQLLNTHVYNGRDIVDNRGLLLLKSNREFEQFVMNWESDLSAVFAAAREMQEFVEILLPQLRLFKDGDVCCKAQFQVAVDNRKFVGRYSPMFQPPSNSKFLVDDSEALQFGEFFKMSFSVNKLTELAFVNFNAAYSLVDPRAKYVLLMTCLESLFNQNSTEISHTISRHLSLILSNNKAEFDVNYKKVKKIYNLRSKIVHGSDIKDNIQENLHVLNNFVRIAIRYCLKKDITKEAFFDWLNVTGFDF